MTNEELHLALYRKLFDEQEQYRKVLLTLPPEKILDHAYEYAARDDILLSFEYHNLSDDQAKVLLKGEHPLKDFFDRWENRETDYMDDIWNTVGVHANDMARDETLKVICDAR